MSSQQPTDVPPIDDWNRLLEGRVAVVTGGGVGIGAAIARLFAEHGAHVEIGRDRPRAGRRITCRHHRSRRVGAGPCRRRHGAKRVSPNWRAPSSLNTST